MIELKNISKNYGGQKIFSKLYLNIQKGEVLSIVGPSGAGKTTLLRCIKGLDIIDSGEIFIDNLNVSQNSQGLPAKESFKKIGYVFQDLYLFQNFTVFENIDLPLRLVKKIPKLDRKIIIDELLEKMEIPQKANAYPSQLSGGQQQRVAIARSLAMSPEAILFDEPTSALDSNLKSKTFRLIKNLASERNLAVVLVTHEAELALEFSDLQYRLDNGNLTLNI